MNEIINKNIHEIGILILNKENKYLKAKKKQALTTDALHPTKAI